VPGDGPHMSTRSAAVLTACFCTVFTMFAIRLSYGVLLPEMLPSLGITKTEAGVIYSLYFIAYTVFSPVLGLLADRISIRVLLCLFSVVLGIGTFFMAYSSSLVEASLFFLLTGIGASAGWSPVVALAQRWVSDKRRGLTLGVIDAGGSLGVAMSSLAMPLIVVAHNWRMGWKILGVSAFLVAAMNFFLVRSRPAGQPDLRHPTLSQHRNEPVTRIYARLLTDIRFWLIGLSYLLIGFSALIPTTFLSTYAVEELTLRYSVATRLMTIMYLAAIGGKLILGPLSDAVGRIRILMMCNTLIAGASLAIAYSHGFPTLHLFSALFGFGYGGIFPLYAACASDYFSKDAVGGIVGLWTLCLGVGFILSPVIAGWTADATGTLGWSFVLATVIGMTSVFLLVLARKALSVGHWPRNQ